MKKVKKNVQIGLGAASILMIFVILCMMVLSVLAFSRAKQNDESAIREKSFQQAYLQSDSKAQIIFELLKENNAQYSDMQTLSKVDEIAQRLVDDGIIYHIERNVLYLNIRVNETQKLSVVLQKTAETIEKQSWKLQSIGGKSK